MCSNNKLKLQGGGGWEKRGKSRGRGKCENAPKRRATAEKCRQTQILRHNFIFFFVISRFFVGLFLINFFYFFFFVCFSRGHQNTLTLSKLRRLRAKILDFHFFPTRLLIFFFSLLTKYPTAAAEEKKKQAYIMKFLIK